jgi:hypothetical protein
LWYPILKQSQFLPSHSTMPKETHKKAANISVTRHQR